MTHNPSVAIAARASQHLKKMPAGTRFRARIKNPGAEPDQELIILKTHGDDYHVLPHRGAPTGTHTPNIDDRIAEIIEVY